MLSVYLAIAGILLGLILTKFLTGTSSGPALDATKWQKFELTKKTILNHNSAVYRFKLYHPEQNLGLPIGQHVSIRRIVDGKEVVKSYTPISLDNEKGYFDLMIKSYPGGKISEYISQLKVGDKIEVRGPKGFFNYTPNMVHHLNMVAGGTGVTPMLQIIKAIVSNPQDKTTVDLIYANVNPEDILLKQEIDEITLGHPQVSVHYVLNNPPEQWDGHAGFVTVDIMKKTLKEPSGDSKLLICGPLPMVSALKKASVELGWEKPKPVSKLDHQVFVF